ncbi:MAG: glutaredoxin domain-containing protein [Thermodesulfobacteriota bacterium]|nr:glutaredoxin domain-containing protein [Thermodesulfobacteriota bacterium]|tara:strand:- start:1207 stop:1443 length:237 start_codon:yes stop_codon:yes gene_type:complete
MKIELYTTKNCPFCVAAKNLLDSKNLEYSEIDLTDNIDLRLEISTKYNWRTVPLILINDELVGGYDDLNALNDAGKLI